MGAALAHPVQNQLLQRAGNGLLRVGSAEMQGFRLSMEDTHTLRLSLSKAHPELSFFGVYDGHAGDKASIYLSEQLVESVSTLTDPTNPALLTDRLIECDNEFLTREADRSHGSAGIIALVRSPVGSEGKSDRKYGVTIANVGDSRALLIRGSDGKCISLSNDHKPELPGERARIMAAGGFVQANRVDGQLAMSRAFGDWPYKGNSKLKADEQKVIPVPEIMTETGYDGDALLICCDGIFEQLSNEQVAAFVYEELKKSDADPAAIAGKLLLHSLQAGSKDNHSAMLVLFKSGDGYEAKDEFIAGPFRPFQNDKKFVEAYLADAGKHGYKGGELMKMAAKAEANMPEIKDDDDDGPSVPLAELLSGAAGGDQQARMMALRSLIQNLTGGGGGRGGLSSLLGGADIEVEDDDGEGDDGDEFMGTRIGDGGIEIEEEEDDDVPVKRAAKKGAVAVPRAVPLSAALSDDGEPHGEVEELVEVSEGSESVTPIVPPTFAPAKAAAAASGVPSSPNTSKKKRKKPKKKGKGK